MENNKNEPRKPENPVIQPDPKNMPEPPPLPSANKSNPAADGDGKTEIDHHKKETEEQQPKADPFKRTDYHQPTPDQTFAAANKINKEKHADVITPDQHDTGLDDKQPAAKKDDSITDTGKTTAT